MDQQLIIYKIISEYLDDEVVVKKASEAVFISLLPQQQKKIYCCLTNSPQSVGDISKKAGLESKNVSSQLRYMREKCFSISYIKKDKNKLWYIQKN